MESPEAAAAVERVWRVRKGHTWIDARIRTHAEGCDVDFFYGGARLCTRRFPGRALAEADAAATLRDLQRVGWTTHW